jgi:hypothetical protein
MNDPVCGCTLFMSDSEADKSGPETDKISATSG